MKRSTASIAIAAIALAGAAWLISSTADRDGGPDSDRAQLRDIAVTPSDADAAAGLQPAAEPVRRAEPEVARSPADAAPRRMLHGRTVDERRRPLAGVAVAYTIPGAAPLSVATSDERGEFVIAAPSGTFRSALSARTADGRIAMRNAWLASAADDLGVLVLGRASVLRVHATSGGLPVAGARVALDVGQTREPLAEDRTDASGTATFDAVPDGFAWIRADATDGAATLAGRARAFLPDVTEIAVELAPAIAIDVRVVDKATGEPVAGARLKILEGIGIPQQDNFDGYGGMGDSYTWRDVPGATLTTDADGRARIRDLAEDVAFDARVSAEGFRPIPGAPPESPVRLSAATPPQVIALTRAPVRAVRVPVVAGELPVPRAGTPLDVAFAPGGHHYGDERAPPGALAMGAGEIAIPSWDGWAHFVARAPDGAIAKLVVRDGKDAGDETSFVRARSIAVTVRDAGGAPVAGARATASNPGNNPYGPPVATDAAGRVALTGLLPELVNVRIAAPGEEYGSDAGSVDLEKGDGAFDFVLPAVATCRIAIRIDGALALPSRFRVGAGMHRARVLEEFPERGELRVGIALEPGEIGKPVTVGLSAEEGGGMTDVVPVVGGAEPVAEIALVRKAGLDVVVSRPPKTRVQIGMERFQEANQRFVPTAAYSGQRLSLPNGPGDTFRFRGLGPGVYRATDETSKSVSLPVVVAEGAIARVELTVGPRKSVTGRVVAPDGTDLSVVRVIVEGDVATGTGWRSAVEIPDGAYVGKDGAFDVAVPGDRDVVVRPWHPWLQPAADGGRFTTRDGAAGVTLRLEASQEVHLPVAQLPDPFARVGVWQGAATGEPQRWLYAPIVGGVARFGGLAPGRYALLVDPMRKLAPLVLPQVDVVEGVTELPAASFAPGSTVRVRILAPPGRDPPRMSLSVEHLDAPKYSRSGGSDGQAEVTLSGLGAGRFRVRCSSMERLGDALDREVVLDGATETRLEVDLR